MDHLLDSDAPTWSRRWVLRGLLTGGAFALCGGAALLGGGARRVLAASRALMGTTATILVTGERLPRVEVAVDSAFARMEEVARHMTRFDTSSDVGRVNGAPGQRVTVHPLTARVLEAGLAYARASDGAFDPALDRLETLWGFHGPARPRNLPAPEQLAPWRGRDLYRSVGTGGTTSAPYVQLTDPLAGLDLGGIAKGFAVDAAVAELRRFDIRNALVEAGGDLYALGRDPHGSPWPVGVRHPRDPSRLLTTLRLSDEAVATSGDDAQFFEVDGRRYSHLIEPGRAQPAAFVRSVTVRAPRAMHADALATAAAVMEPARARALLGRLGAGRWLAMDSTGRLLEG